MTNTMTNIDYEELKIVMRTYMGNIVDTHNFVPLFTNNNTYAYSDLPFIHKCVLMTSTYPGMDDFLEYYLNHNRNAINEIDNKGRSALHRAVADSRFYSTEKTIKILINAGYDINLKNNRGCTPLHIALIHYGANCTENTVEILINAGAKINLQDNYGKTALHYAAFHCATQITDQFCIYKIIELLINSDADVFNIKNDEGKPPIDYFNEDIKNYLKIDTETQTIGIKKGGRTKCAKNDFLLS